MYAHQLCSRLAYLGSKSHSLRSYYTPSTMLNADIVNGSVSPSLTSGLFIQAQGFFMILGFYLLL